MPAILAMPSTSPFLAVPDWMMARVSGCIWISPVATATRWVAGLLPTSTMCACPCWSKWVRAAWGSLGVVIGECLRASLRSPSVFLEVCVCFTGCAWRPGSTVVDAGRDCLFRSVRNLCGFGASYDLGAAL